MDTRFADAKILVVDDEAGVTRLCERFLTRAGFQVLTANHPNDGLQILRRQELDLLLADIRMPQLDGFQLLKLAREQQPDLSVLIMTGYGTVETAVEALHQGADGMVLKPFSGAELVQSVEQALRNRQREREVQRLQALRPLFEISESLFAETSPERLRDRLLDVLGEQIPCAHVSLYRHTGERGWEQTAVRGMPFDVSASFPPEWGQIDELSFCASNQVGSPEIRQDVYEHGLGFLACTPLNYADVRQFLLIARRAGEPAFNELELETFRILARQAVVALENAQLYDELQEHIRKLETSQQALAQAEKMAAVGRLTAAIAHEINNPLHSIRNCLHLAGRDELSEASRREYLELASEETERLMSTVHQMLDFYRPSALDRKPAALNALIDRVIKLLDAQFTARQIVVRRQYAPDLPLILAVENQIQQVFFNLFLNAIEAMPSGGEIVVTTAHEGGQVLATVSDSGPGIAPEDREEIFEPFVSSKSQGLGLGLTVSYGVITAHGGSLSLLPQSEHEQGACFQISLPVYN